MRFVVQADRRPPSDEGPQQAILVPVAGDDHGYQTSYDLWFRDGNGQIQCLGRVKIALGAQEPGPSPLPVGQFETLDSLRRPELFSLGQDDLYYDNIRKLGTQVRLEILIGLGDIASSSKRLDFALQHDVTTVSLLRSVEKRTVRSQFKRISSGGSRLTDYRFNYLVPAPDSDVPPPPPLSFVVTPRTIPSSNIHVLIGRNGVGKTTLLRNMAQAAVHPDHADVNAGRIEHLPTPTAEDGEPFVNVVSVTFSAFDPFVGVVGNPDHAATTYAYVGLASAGNNLGEPKSHEQLGSEFASCLKEVWASGRLGRWVHALRILSSDPHFADSPVHDFARRLRERSPQAFMESDQEAAWRIFSQLSSGHAIVLLTITKLVELVAEQSLVLLDEPEAHLHPPLLSSFITTLSYLMDDRNAVAVIATHSPVVLQEVPRSCVWKLSRWGNRQAERPTIETFGENVGVLTHEIFGLEVKESGFYTVVERAVRAHDTYEEVLAHFGGQLGGEAKGLVRILLADKTAGESR